MDPLGGGSALRELHEPGDAKCSGESLTGAAVFDASQYEFFGHDVLEEVELGGLEDEEDVPAVGFEDDTFQLDRVEGGSLRSIDVDDLTGSFSKLNNVVGGPGIQRFSNDEGSKESSSVDDWTKEVGYSTWYNQPIHEARHVAESEQWSSQPHDPLGFKPLYRTSSYPESHPYLHTQQPQPQPQHILSEPIAVPRSSFPSYPPPGGGTPPITCPLHRPSPPYVDRRPQMMPSSQNLSPFVGNPIEVAQGSELGGNLSEFSLHSHSANNQSHGQWFSQTNVYHGDQSGHLNNMQQPPLQNGLGPQLNHQQRQHGLNQQVHAQFNQLSGMLCPQMYGPPHLSASPPMMNKFDSLLNYPDMRDQRPKTSSQGSRQNMHYHQPAYANNIQGINGPWPKFRSRYMTAEEIENIIRMQLAATHSNDPYVDDYYHQACLAKKSSGARLKHHFCPNQLREISPRARSNDEPHAFLKVDALGRIPFSSIRRPKPLLEVDSMSPSVSGTSDQNIPVKPLEQEPLLAARVTIEDGLCMLLEIDDIDRYLQFNKHLPDGGVELRQRRHSLVESLAASFHLVDPLAKEGRTAGLAPRDDLVFMRIVSLPKGRKLLSKYLVILPASGDLLRIVSMAVFRHLRFMFGLLPTDSSLIEITSNLATAVSARVHEMDLNSLSSCLAAVVCSSEQPPLRPVGSSSGDGASIVLKSVLDRATELLKDPRVADSFNMPNRGFWQASFDEFFGLLVKYCINKYDSIVQPMILHAPLNSSTAAIESDVSNAIKKEMPVELLRASLPHTNEIQRKLLMDFSQRSVPTVGRDSHMGGNGNCVNC